MSDISFPFPVGSLVACSWSMTYCAQGSDMILDRNKLFILLSEVVKYDPTSNWYECQIFVVDAQHVGIISWDNSTMSEIIKRTYLVSEP
jgi:hypothetical protein